MRSQDLAGFGFITAAAILWGSLGLLSRLLDQHGVSPLEIAFYRAALGGACFAAHAVVTGVALPRGRDLGLTALFGLVGVSLYYGAYQTAIDAGGIGLAVILLYTAPAFVVLLMWAAFGERPKAMSVVLTAGVLLGVLAVSMGGGAGLFVSARSLGWGLASGFLYALYFLFGRTVLTRHAPAAVFSLMLPIGAVGLFPFVSFSPKTMTVWVLLAPTCVLSTYFAYAAYAAGIRRLDPVRASVTASLEPVIALGLAAFVGERPSHLSLAGAALLVLAVASSGAAPRRQSGST